MLPYLWSIKDNGIVVIGIDNFPVSIYNCIAFSIKLTAK